MIRCWTCSKFAVVFVKKAPVLDCGHGSLAEYTREYGFVHSGCPEYNKDTDNADTQGNEIPLS